MWKINSQTKEYSAKQSGKDEQSAKDWEGVEKTPFTTRNGRIKLQHELAGGLVRFSSFWFGWLKNFSNLFKRFFFIAPANWNERMQWLIVFRCAYKLFALPNQNLKQAFLPFILFTVHSFTQTHTHSFVRLFFPNCDVCESARTTDGKRIGLTVFVFSMFMRRKSEKK